MLTTTNHRDPFALDRHEIIEILENNVGMACYDEESTDELRSILVDSTQDKDYMDGVLCNHRDHTEYRANYFYYLEEAEEPPLSAELLGEITPAEAENYLEEGCELLSVPGLNSSQRFYWQVPL